MIFTDILRTIAPTIATALGGPAAGIGVKFLADKFLGKPDASTEEVLTAIHAATPSDLARLKELDHQFLLEHGRQVVELTQIDAQDRASARLRETELAKAGFKDNIPGILALGFSACFFIIYFAMIIYPEYKNVDVIIGLSNLEALILGYYFGSSDGSRAKDHLLKRE